MSNQENNNSVKKNNKLFQAIIAILILAFIAFMMSDLFNPAKSKTVKPNISKEADSNLKFRKDGELTFQNKKKEFISTIDLEFAETAKERAQGLMYRTKLAENQGMLFIFPSEEMQSFWMHNTVLPLDMIFVNSNLQIVTIRKNTKPYDDSSYPSTEPAQYVIEVNAGYTDKFGIKVGDIVVFRRTN